MIVRIRDLISAFILLPLCFAGGMLTAFLWSIFKAVQQNSTTTETPTTYAPQGASTSAAILSSMITLMIVMGIVGFYLYRYKKLKESNPNAIVFGEVSLDTALVLGIIAFVGPAIGMAILLVMFG